MYKSHTNTHPINHEHVSYTIDILAINMIFLENQFYNAGNISESSIAKFAELNHCNIFPNAV